LKVVQVDMQQGCAGCGDAAPQRRLDMLDVVEALCAMQIDDQMRAGTADTIANHEVVMALIRRQSCNVEFRLLDFRSGGTWGTQALSRS
jgi:hypothetical protein